MNTTQRWLLVLIMALCAFTGFITGRIQEQAASYEYIADHSETIEHWHYWGDLANQLQAAIAVIFGVIMAAFTYMLYRVTDMQRQISDEQKLLLEKDIGLSEAALAEARESTKLSRAAVLATEMAAKETTRSVNAYINAERGVLQHYRSQLHEQRVQFSFQNIGNGPLTLVKLFVEAVAVTNGELPPRLINGSTDLFIGLRAGEVISTYDFDHVKAGVLNADVPIGDAVFKKYLVGTHRIVTQFLIIYATPQRLIYANRVALVFTNGSRGFSVLDKEGFRYDKVIPNVNLDPDRSPIIDISSL